jgi:ribonuclease HI
MELMAIQKALEFIPMVRAYVVIESYSEGCLKMTLGQGETWMADNFTNLAGLRTKNRALVNEITLRLRTLHTQFRKVKGHSRDQWNDRVDCIQEAAGKSGHGLVRFDGSIERGRAPQGSTSPVR